ncbi:Thioredoxin [Orchesella cincta]|uniref:Thioredoxin n=1 Tax=Orchesella cincta TaxID=48709 RepID=A0A1D2MVB9_ORCCI|nr:Thioredoxin [Orchesella cincta]
MTKFLTVSIFVVIASMFYVDVCNAKQNILDIPRYGVFKVAVLRNQKPVVVFFTKSSCAICQKIWKDLESIARANDEDMYLAKIDVEEAPEFRELLKITNIPQTQTYFKGQLVSQVKGPNWVGIEAIVNHVLLKGQQSAKKQ